MKLGFFTACLPDVPLDHLAAWAAQASFEALEVAAWPRSDGRDHTATHIDVTSFTRRDADTVRCVLAGHNVALSAIGYYENNLHGDSNQRAAIHQHLRACIDAAQLLGVPHVGTFVGRDITRTVEDNLRLGEEVLPRLVDYAGERGVKLVVENCPMEGWHPDGYPANLAYSPELWEWMFTLGLHLNYDPSHLIWLGIDPVDALRPHLNRVVHVQAKDTEVRRNRPHALRRLRPDEGPHEPLGHRVVALPRPGTRQRRLVRSRRRFAGRRIPGNDLDRTRGSRVERQHRPGQTRPRNRS